MPGQIPENIRLFRIVHWENVEHILNHGLCYSGHQEANPNFINIGHQQLIADRHEYPITQLPGAGSLGEYIPFYFGPLSPMLLLIKEGSRFVEKRPQEDIVYVVSSVAAIKTAGLEYCFTDSHAKRAFARFFREDEDFDKIDWDVVRLRYWNNISEYQDRMDFKQAEFLVRHRVPIACVRGLIVKTNDLKLLFEEMIAKLQLPIKVHLDAANKYYY